ncbi:MAG: glycosyltransferase [Acidimicrobiia bacterium]|nr:glycosyltransferase [Acidimicrobiia bacterium]
MADPVTETALVSCVMPTGAGRERFVPKALDHWSRQTYTHREMIVVDDAPDPAPGRAACRDRTGVSYIPVPATSLGEKLNVGVEAARGSVVQKWDDDDIYRPAFLETATRWLARTPADARFVVWDSYLVYLAWSGGLYRTGPGHKAGPSICFGRELWEANPFRDVPRAVDSHWIADHPDFTAVTGHEDELILVRHGANTWTEFHGIHVDGYIEAELERWPVPFSTVIDPDDQEFYDRLREELHARMRLDIAASGGEPETETS